MRIGAFEVEEPLPELNTPCVFAILHPWIDVNGVGTMVLNELETQFGAKELARLARPGRFFDFTRYRPTLYLEGGIRKISIPNITLRYAKREGGDDLIFLHLLEPHALSEVFVDSILRLLTRLKVKRYVLLGSMYDAVPHTRPIIVNGGAIGKEAELDLKKSGALKSHYQGPTTITFLITQKAPELDMEAVWFIVSLPQYVVLDEDYLGKVRLMEILNLLYRIPVDRRDFEKALEQRSMISQKVERSAELKNLLPQLETLYDLRIKSKEGERVTKLSSEIEEILWSLTGKDSGKA
ncbi:MAG TPA: PAC2 family protein [Thermodesulfobacteriota bacterium]|nr:PAC2 family protein [Thermodesulfobacteriota bacterium]